MPLSSIRVMQYLLLRRYVATTICVFGSRHRRVEQHALMRLALCVSISVWDAMVGGWGRLRILRGDVPGVESSVYITSTRLSDKFDGCWLS